MPRRPLRLLARFCPQPRRTRLQQDPHAARPGAPPFHLSKDQTGHRNRKSFQAFRGRYDTSVPMCNEPMKERGRVFLCEPCRQTIIFLVVPDPPVVPLGAAVASNEKAGVRMPVNMEGRYAPPVHMFKLTQKQRDHALRLGASGRGAVTAPGKRISVDRA